MNFNIAFKWALLLFCIITTAQLILTIVLSAVASTTMHAPLFTIMHLKEHLLISLASALPIFVLAEGRFSAKIPLFVRRAVHFLLTFCLVFGLLLYFGWYHISPWLILPFALFLIVYISATFLFERLTRAKNTALRQKEEQEHLRFYTQELEVYQKGIQKFKHDYQNILSSLDAYIEDEDLAGLKEYYYSSIKPASDTIASDRFALAGLEKIKIRAIKSVLFAKLILAQNMGQNIQVIFEANEDIDHIDLDLVTFVRMVGILLDNAIEELSELTHGTLTVSFFKWKAGITFIVKNTCRPNLPATQQLWQTGFSTKGESRGLGLSNLSELADAHPNITLSTKIREGTFQQELLIEPIEKG